MSTIFNEGQLELQQDVRSFAENELRPHLDEIITCEGFVPQELYRHMGDHGLLGLMVSKERGGMGMGITEVCIACEELSKVAPVFGLMLMCIAPPIAGLEEDEAFRTEYLPKILRGEIIYSGGLTAPEGHTNATEWQPVGSFENGEWVLNGSKLFVTCSLKNDLHQMYGFDQDRNLKMWFIEGDAPGFTHNAPEVKFGMKGSGGGTVTYKNVRIRSDMCRDAVMGGDTELYAMLWITCAAISLGTMEGALSDTIEYTRTHSRGGKMLSQDQAIAQKLARLQAMTFTARSFTYDAARCFDSPQHFKEGCMMCQASKVTVVETGYEVAKECLRIQGMSGYSTIRNYHYLPDSISMMIADQTTEAALEALAHSMGLLN